MGSTADVRRTTLALCVAGLVLSVVASTACANIIVRFDTSLGQFDIELFDTETPDTVQNFLNYINRGDYIDSFFHRLADEFVLQGGGFAVYPDGAGAIWPVEHGAATKWIDKIPTVEPIDNENEYNRSNLRGTIAMAKTPGDPDSATSEFFFNLVDNVFLDSNNGGFTVFAEVIGTGMDVVDLLASQQIWPNGSSIHNAFGELPLIDFTDGDPLRRDHLLMINHIIILPDTGVPGDANGDGITDIVDLTALAANWGIEGGATLLQGDFNGDGDVNRVDFGYVWIGWGLIDDGGGTIPEPVGLALMGIGSLVLIRRRKK